MRNFLRKIHAVRRNIGSICPILMGTMLFSACAHQTAPSVSTAKPTEPSTGLQIEKGPHCLGCEPRKAPVSLLILHYTAGSLPASLDILQGKKAEHRVGAHYLVTDEVPPRVIRLVPENMSAFHAGKSAWGNLDWLNQHSIGIEIVHPDGNIVPYSPAQAALVADLCADIVRRHRIHPTKVLGHSDVAIGRKVDPGVLFPWSYLAARGVGAWPSAEEVRAQEAWSKSVKPDEVRGLLSAYGYRIEPGEAGLKAGLEAFQKHFRARKTDGVADMETVAILRALLRLPGPSDGVRR